MTNESRSPDSPTPGWMVALPVYLGLLAASLSLVGMRSHLGFGASWTPRTWRLLGLSAAVLVWIVLLLSRRRKLGGAKIPASRMRRGAYLAIPLELALLLLIIRLARAPWTEGSSWLVPAVLALLALSVFLLLAWLLRWRALVATAVLLAAWVWLNESGLLAASLIVAVALVVLGLRYLWQQPAGTHEFR